MKNTFKLLIFKTEESARKWIVEQGYYNIVLEGGWYRHQFEDQLIGKWVVSIRNNKQEMNELMTKYDIKKKKLKGGNVYLTKEVWAK